MAVKYPKIDRTLVLTLVGLGAIIAAAWLTWGLAAGLLGIGLGLLVIEYLMREG